MQAMVPRQQLDAVREAASQAELEAQRLRERLERMVPRSDLQAREADNERLTAEVRGPPPLPLLSYPPTPV